jgi:hypothetical protein
VVFSDETMIDLVQPRSIMFVAEDKKELVLSTLSLAEPSAEAFSFGVASQHKALVL